MSGEKPLQHRLQLNAKLPSERAGELSTAKTRDGVQGLFAMGRGTGIHMLEHGKQSPFTEAEECFGLRRSIRKVDFRAFGWRMTSAIARSSAPGVKTSVAGMRARRVRPPRTRICEK